MKSKFLLAITACVMSITYSQAQNVSFKDNIVSNWKLDETSGTTTTDNITGASGDVMGEAANWAWGTGIMNGALDFTNSDTTNITLIEDSPALAPINFTDNPFSLSIWVKCSQDAIDGLLGNIEQMFIVKGDNGTDGPNGNGMRYMMSSKEGKLYFAVDDNESKSQLSALPDEFTWPADEWTNLVGIRSMGTLEADVYDLKLYLNGELVKTEVDGTLVPLNLEGQRLLIGNYHNKANPLHGSIDEVMMINKALNEDEVKELYASYMSSGIFDNRTITNITIAPNPVNSELMIYNANTLSKVEVYNLSGMLVKTITNQNDATISSNVDELPAGTYIVKGYSQDNVLTSGSFIKN